MERKNETMLVTNFKKDKMKRFLLFMLPLMTFVPGIAQNTFPSSGNVGIGTTSPIQPLDVRGWIYTTGSLQVDGGDVFISRLNTPYGYVCRPDSNGYRNLEFAVAGGGPLDNLILNSAASYFTGIVGVNTPSPTATLDVFNPASSSLQKGLFLHSGSFGTGANAQARYFLKAQDDGNGATQFILHGDGSVGIRTDVENGYALSVNGDAICTRMVVLLKANWPDYVFDRKYQLTPLRKIEKYIRDNHHLPDMPSADSVAKVGVVIGAGQAALLRKIEEMTLYIIDQNKSLDELKRTTEDPNRSES